MKNRYKIITAALACAALLSGCKLVETSYEKVYDDLYPSNYTEADELMLGSMYYGFTPWYVFNSTQGWMMRSSLVSDEYEANHAATYIGFDMTGQNNPELGIGGYPITDEWTESNLPLYMYMNYISKARLTKERIKNVQMTDAQRNLLNAQLDCGIGWLAFIEYDMYGPISLPGIEILQSPARDEIVPRATEEEMRKFIEDHLWAAVDDNKGLPYSWGGSDYGRFTRGLGYMALFDYYMKIGKWDKAEECGRELLDPKYGYGLVDDYNSLFTLAGEKNKEVIFSVVCDYEIGQTFPSSVLPSDFPTPGVNMDKWNVYKMTWAFYDTFEADDERALNIVTEYSGKDSAGEIVVHNRTNDRQYDRYSPKGTLYLGPLPIKYDYTQSVGMMSPIDMPVYRFGGALLLLAEAIVRNGNSVTGEAVDFVNQVRDRAGLDPLDIADFPDVDSFLDAVLAERGHELWFEGHRRRDLIRHGKYIDACMQKARNAGLPDARVEKMKQQTVAGKYDYELLPIPTRVIDEGKGIIKQNPGY